MTNLKQEYSKYTKDDFWIWNKLYTEQTKNLINKSCLEFHICLKELEKGMHAEKIADFIKLNKLVLMSLSMVVYCHPNKQRRKHCKDIRL